MSPRRGLANRPARAGRGTAQAWVVPIADDPEAVSAFRIAHSRLADARALTGLRRARVFELAGALPARARVEALLHRSIQFYNPHKERCALRMEAADPAPVDADETAVIVIDRGESRRPAAERWWRHEAGESIEVREGVAWMLTFAAGTPDRAALAEAIATTRDRRHGVLCNPHAQDHHVSVGPVPLGWMREAESPRE